MGKISVSNGMLVETSPSFLQTPTGQDEPRALFDNLGFLEGGLGGLSIGLLALGLVLQQYGYRRNSIDSGFSSLGLYSSNSNQRRNPNRRLYTAKRRRKIDPEDNASGYGIVSAATNAYKVIKMIPDVIETVQSALGVDDYEDYDEYTLEEAFFNQLEEERLEKKREKRRKKKRKN